MNRMDKLDEISHYVGTASSCLVKILQKPFKDDILYFLLLWCINSLSSLYIYFKSATKYALYIALLYYILTYIIVCLLDINKYIEKIFKPLLFFSLYIFNLMNIYCIQRYNCRISMIIEIIKGTNIREIQEYFTTYFTTQHIIVIFIFISLGFFLSFIAVRFQYNTPRIIRHFLQGVLLLAIIAIWHNPMTIKDELATNRWLVHIDQIINLEKHLTHPNVNISTSYPPPQLPQYVVVIIGESFAPSHSSLYGYKKNTNPLLNNLVDSGNLIVYDRITSPKTNTTDAFKYILNAYRLGMEKECKWYDTTSLIEVMSAVDYYTVWLSNQEANGIYNNLPSGHSRICDEAVFMTADSDRNKYDGALIDIEISSSHKPQAIFYHLMGQHTSFQHRYPKDYNIFKHSDYQCIESQRETMAEYDNATLYNDYVVRSIIDKYKDSDAIVFYFSDHGIDIYDTDPNYFGHARYTPESQSVGRKIPFMVYISDMYQQLRPETTERIRKAVDKEYCTDKFIYAVMDAIGIQFADNDDVARFSLFNNN